LGRNTLIHHPPVDAVVIGAGPAGCCAALRLLALGYNVAVVERRPFPRPQIGESLSPGIWNILDYIGAGSALEPPHFLAGLSARVIWERRESEALTADKLGTGVMVDRAQVDSRLLELVKVRGGSVIQPAQIQGVMGEPHAWQLRVEAAGRQVQVNARLIFDATGRAGQNAGRFPTAPTTLAMWSHISNGVMPAETCVEAIRQGWLWGAPLPDGRYRAMAFFDPDCYKRRKGSLEEFFRGMLNDGRLFKAAAGVPLVSSIQSCVATSYLDPKPWQPGYIKLGEAAFALDPLSSTGVEKAMRFTLQAVIAANTVLRNSAMTGLAQEFYESRLLESVATHAVWARSYYQSAWPGDDHEFWRRRSQARLVSDGDSDFVRRLGKAYAVSEKRQAYDESQPDTNTGFEAESVSAEALTSLLQSRVALSPEIRFSQMPCVVDDEVQLRPVVTSPRLPRPIAFLEGVALVPLLEVAPVASDLNQLIRLWSIQMPPRTAARTALWLVQHGLLIMRCE
jgi:flavin-dependent dehydrogenase